MLKLSSRIFTSLQDGARSQQAQQPRRPFLFATIKGSTGHQESGAGVAGLMEASRLVQGAAAPPALHLRHLNPHVHGALAAYAVSIARGGPFGVPRSQGGGAALLVGVSSFGAQGTNAHALLAGSSAEAVISSWSAGSPPAWRRSRCYVAPAVQQLLTGCLLLRKRGRGGSGGGGMTLESSLSGARLAYNWQYVILGRSFLAGSAVLGMAASLLPLLGAVAAGEDQAGADVAAVLEAAMVAPAMLPLAAASKVSLTVARVKLTGASGAVEVSLAGQQLLAARLATPLEAAQSTQGDSLSAMLPSTRLRSELVPAASLPVSSWTSAAPAAVVADTSALTAAEVSGYALHPVLLDACLGQVAAAADATTACSFSWMRSVAALLVGSSSPVGGMLSATYQPADSWLAGSTSLAAGSASGLAAEVLGAVLGDHDMPPASPGPTTMPATARAGIPAELAGGEEEEEAAGIPADHPLLQMAEEERLLHLQAQVCACLWRYHASALSLSAFCQGPATCSHLLAHTPPTGDERGARHAGSRCAPRRTPHGCRP